MQKGFIFVFFLLFFSASGTNQKITGKRYSAVGYASFYAEQFHGRTTANGELFDMLDYTAAHRTLPFGTFLRVTNLKNKYSIIVRVNDRGPYAKGRIIDLSEGAARRIGSYAHGITKVHAEEINLLQLTPELENIFSANAVVDCLGNIESLSGYSLSLWSTNDLLHAIYIANDLYLKEDIDKVYIVSKKNTDSKKYHVVISGIENRVLVNELKNYFERQGFTNVVLID